MNDDDDDGSGSPPLSDSQRYRHQRMYPPGTPVVKSPVVQSSEDRDLSSRKRREKTRSYPIGVPITGAQFNDSDETTDPLAMLPVIPEEEDVEALRRAGHDTDQPVRMVQLHHVVRIVKDQLRKERVQSEKRQGKELRELLDRPPRDVADKLTSDIAMVKKVAGVIAVALLGLAGTVAKGLYDRGGRDTAVDMSIHQIKYDLDKLDKTIDLRLGKIDERINVIIERDDPRSRRGDTGHDQYLREPTLAPSAPISPPLPTQKGQTP